MFEPAPRPRRVNVDKIDGVLSDKNGGAVVVATRGGRQYRISLPDAAISDLIAKLEGR